MRKLLTISIIFLLLISVFLIWFLKVRYTISGAEYLGISSDVFRKNKFADFDNYGYPIYPHDILPDTALNFESSRKSSVIFSKEKPKFFVWLSNYKNDSLYVQELLVYDKSSSKIKPLISENDYSQITYSFSDKYVFFSHQKHIDSSIRSSDYDGIYEKYRNGPYLYSAEDGSISFINLGLTDSIPKELNFRFDLGAPIKEDAVYFPTYRWKDEGQEHYILSYNFKTKELKKVIKLRNYASNLFIDGGYLYFNSGLKCGIDCLPTKYRIII